MSHTHTRFGKGFTSVSKCHCEGVFVNVLFLCQFAILSFHCGAQNNQSQEEYTVIGPRRPLCPHEGVLSLLQTAAFLDIFMQHLSGNLTNLWPDFHTGIVYTTLMFAIKSV